jgi:hypothetical protein
MTRPVIILDTLPPLCSLSTFMVAPRPRAIRVGIRVEGGKGHPAADGRLSVTGEVMKVDFSESAHPYGKSHIALLIATWDARPMANLSLFPPGG